MRPSSGWGLALMVIGAISVVAALGGGLPGPILLGLVWYAVPVLLIGILLADLRRIAESLERIEGLLRRRESRRREPLDSSAVDPDL